MTAPKWGPGDPLPSLGWQLINWVEEFLPFGPGPLQGYPLVLDDEIAAHYVQAYSLVPDDRYEHGWRPRYSRSVFSRMKGRAKSSNVAAPLVCAHALGPVVFDGFDADGEPVARPVRSPEILCMATELGQADRNTFSVVTYMLEHGKVAGEYPGVDLGRGWQTCTRVLLPDGGEIEPVSGGALSKDGGKSTFLQFDEPHLMFSREIIDAHGMLVRNLGAKRPDADPRACYTTTMFRVGQDSIAEQLFDFAEAVKAGRVKSDRRIFFDHRQSSHSMAEIGDDDDALYAALVEAAGDSAEWRDLHRLVDEIRAPDAQEPDRWYLNRRTTGVDLWMDMDRYDAALVLEELREVKAEDLATWGEGASPLAPEEGEEITLGFDGSFGTSDQTIADSSVLRGCRVSDGYRFTVGIWEQPLDLEDWEPDRDEVDSAIRWAMKVYVVKRLYADPAWWHDELDSWVAEYGEDRVVRWYTHRDRPMAGALERLKTGTIEAKSLHDGDPRIRSHYGNTHKRVRVARDDDGGGAKELILVRKEHRKSSRKIDAVLSDALALEARGDVLAAAQPRKGKGGWGF